MITSTVTISKRYRLLCWVTFISLVLFGYVCIAVSRRTTTLNCQRSDLKCTISHVGLLSDAGATFNINDVKRVGMESSARLSGYLDYYHLFFETELNIIPITCAV